ncbi:MAG TPA: glycosyltransferase family 4 protein [Thermoleophilaceae bacterium]
MTGSVPRTTVLVFHLGGAGGPAHSLLPEAEELARTGRLETFVPEPGWVADRFGRLGPVTIGRYGALTYARRPRDLALLVRRLAAETRGFRTAFRDRRPDLVMVATTTMPAALVAARLERIPTLVYAAEIHGDGWKASRARRLWAAALLRATAAVADGIVCCSHAVAQQFPVAEPHRIAVAYPAIRDEVAGGDRERGRRRLGLEGAGPCLVVVGAISRGRGQDVALRALALVRSRHPAARLAIAGAPHPRAVDRAYASELRRLAVELGVADATVFAGELDETADLYAAADVVINPARLEEAFGRVAPEALLAGVPVVATRVGALPEVIRDGVTGLLVPPDDPEALAAAVTRLYGDAALRERIVAAGREDVCARFTVEASRAAFSRVIAAIR